MIHSDSTQLDSGTDERIMLVSRDEQSCLVVSYKEVKSCIDAAFGFVVPSHAELVLTLRIAAIYLGPRAEYDLRIK